MRAREEAALATVGLPAAMRGRRCETMADRRHPTARRRIGRTLRSFGYRGRRAGLPRHGRSPTFASTSSWRSPSPSSPLRSWPAALDVAVLLLAIGLVLVAEALNTALEAVVDLATPDHHPLARIAKDAAAAGVLAGGHGRGADWADRAGSAPASLGCSAET